MLLDGRQVTPGKSLRTHVCVVGAGAAGITIARELAGSKLDVCVLESGGLKDTSRPIDLYRGNPSAGLEYPALETARLNYFGGTTNHWGGTCRPLDAEDFEGRPWVADHGWPISREQLDPYYQRAHEICQLQDYDYDLATNGPGPGFVLPFDPDVVKTVLFQRSPPTRFGQVYRKTLARAANISVYLNTNVMEFVTETGGSRIKYVSCRCVDGPAFRVQADHYVLATGGIENARLLLLSRSHAPNGLGNEFDLVGRYFMEHPHIGCGNILAGPDFDTKPNLYGARYRVKGTIYEAQLALDNSVLKKHQLTNVGLMVRFKSTPRPPKSNWQANRIEDSINAGKWPDVLAYRIKEILLESPSWIQYGYRNITNAIAQEVFLHFRTEQAPNPDSRVRLGPGTDALGRQRVVLDWRLSEIDWRTIERTRRIMALEVGKSRLGRFRMSESDPRHARYGVGFHHMGTTRMAASPRKGVVNADCRMHAVNNLYVAGSSVFATSGYANPTLTIVALAVRLADHLRQQSRDRT